jgi:hypothetical protein
LPYQEFSLLKKSLWVDKYRYVLKEKSAQKMLLDLDKKQNYLIKNQWEPKNNEIIMS